MIEDQLKRGISIYIIVLILFLITGVYILFTGNDPMDTILIDYEPICRITNEPNGISSWPISHFVMYTLLGTFAPKYWYLWFTIGCAWELAEHFVGSNIDLDIKEVDKNSTQYGKKWMEGSFSDILFNSGGLLLGMFFNQISRANLVKTDPII